MGEEKHSQWRSAVFAALAVDSLMLKSRPNTYLGYFAWRIVTVSPPPSWLLPEDEGSTVDSSWKFVQPFPPMKEPGTPGKQCSGMQDDDGVAETNLFA